MLLFVLSPIEIHLSVITQSAKFTASVGSFVIVTFALLFFAHSRLKEERSEIIVTPTLRDRLANLWTTQTGLIASEAEINTLLENWLKEEVLYREALRLGLDQEDTIVRRHLVQKLRFIAESEPLPTPEATELEAFYQGNIHDYTLPIRYSFQQLYFQSQESADNALGQINSGTGAQEVGESSMLNPTYAYRSALDLNATFGTGFADQVASLSIGNWDGPIQSGFGYHLIFINTVHPEEKTPLSVIQQQVTQDFQRSRQITVRDTYIENLLNEYTITVESQ